MDRPAKLAQQFVAAFEIALKSVQTFVIPARQNLLRTVREIRNMDLDVFGLSDSIQPSDALFEQLRIERQVKQDQAGLRLPAVGVPPALVRANRFLLELGPPDLNVALAQVINESKPQRDLMRAL